MLSYCRMMLLLFLLVASTDLAESFTCENRHYCYTDEIKYGAFIKMNNTYLNVSAIQDIEVPDWMNCTRACIKTEGCQSVNMYNQDNNDHCQLLPSNKMSNATNLISRNGSSHFYIPVRHNSNVIRLPCRIRQRQ